MLHSLACSTIWLEPLGRRFRAAAPSASATVLELDPAEPDVLAVVPTAAVDADDDSSDFEPDAKRRRAAAAQRGSRATRAAGAGQKAGANNGGGGCGQSGGGGGSKRRKAATVKKPALGRVKRCSNKQV